MILLRIRPYTTLADFRVVRGSYVCQFADTGPIKEAVAPDFLLGRMLLKDCTLLTTRNGIVGVRGVKHTVLGLSFYKTKVISMETQGLRQSLQPLIEEAIQV